MYNFVQLFHDAVIYLIPYFTRCSTDEYMFVQCVLVKTTTTNSLNDLNALLPSNAEKEIRSKHPLKGALCNSR